jgi:agmatinase
MLIDKQILVDADAPPSSQAARLRTAAAYRFCNAPAFAGSATPDFVILGVPYDLAGDIDSRLAPAVIREKSLEYSYQLEFGDGRPRGWLDVNRGVQMLRGATLADAGNVPVEYGESRPRFFERVGQVLAECCTGKSVPVILGGDRSVTCAALGGLRREGRLTVLQIATQPGRAAAEGAGRQLLQMDKVERVISLGAETQREHGAEETVRAWGDDLALYLSIDLGMFSEAHMTGGPAGLPPGPTLNELKMSIAAIGKAHRIVGIDLVGLDLGSHSPGLTAIVGCHLALAAMSAAYDRL